MMHSSSSFLYMYNRTDAQAKHAQPTAHLVILRLVAFRVLKSDANETKKKKQKEKQTHNNRLLEFHIGEWCCDGFEIKRI